MATSSPIPRDRRLTRTESATWVGLVGRARCPEVARSVWAVLTPAGTERLEEARPTHVATLRESFLGHLDDGELDDLVAVWARVLPASCLR